MNTNIKKMPEIVEKTKEIRTGKFNKAFDNFKDYYDRKIVPVLAASVIIAVPLIFQLSFNYVIHGRFTLSSIPRNKSDKVEVFTPLKDEKGGLIFECNRDVNTNVSFLDRTN